MFTVWIQVLPEASIRVNVISHGGKYYLHASTVPVLGIAFLEIWGRVVVGLTK
jgi:hypothetical protein